MGQHEQWDRNLHKKGKLYDSLGKRATPVANTVFGCFAISEACARNMFRNAAVGSKRSTPKSMYGRKLPTFPFIRQAQPALF